MNRDLSIDQMRENYKKHALLESNVLDNPLSQFKLWFKEAVDSKLKEPNAMCLSTCGSNGQPEGRIVLLKGIKEGFVFYTNYNSAKGQELAQNPKASLIFLWLELERQVRVAGEVRKLAAEESAAYFNSRPLDSQLGAIASNQSEVVANREELENKLQELKSKYSEEYPPEMPEHWGGFELIPTKIEFWQGRPSRLHDRLQYFLNDKGGWERARLSP